MLLIDEKLSLQNDFGQVECYTLVSSVLWHCWLCDRNGIQTTHARTHACTHTHTHTSLA